jgi:hypothetical protein
MSSKLSDAMVLGEEQVSKNRLLVKHDLLVGVCTVSIHINIPNAIYN